MAAPPLLLPEGALLVRVPAGDPGWVHQLPAVPGVPEAAEVTVTLGRPELLPVDTGPLRERGYRIIGAASASLPIGDVVDLLVPGALRTTAPTWWLELLGRAERVFDPGLGPVQRMLHAELSLHMRALSEDH